MASLCSHVRQLAEAEGEPTAPLVSSNFVVSNVKADLRAQYGGVAPKMAEEAHAKTIDKVVQDALDKAKITGTDLSAVALSIGPGLSLCLRAGVQKARNIAGRFMKPIVVVHQMEAHALVAR
ncbi:hypothetical protein CDL15_Pgr028606 [Punica granatum]|uniref:N(6)-L-threonylcarbamoyladenine synthase n=1 Tax=Punica granatum TaxID=22663 RepID=A0A218VX87_PUNGR|nr:hypothetical protein CDL15_Pgr028606 [Punica granatum]